MNKPIQTESRKKNRGDRRQQSGPQDEMKDILTGGVGSPADTPEEREFKETAAAAIEQHQDRQDANLRQPLLSERTNLDMGDGTIFHTGTLEDAQARPSISVEALGRGEIVVTREPVVMQSTEAHQTELNPLEVTGATPPFIATIGEPLAETFQHYRTVAAQPKGDFFDFTKMPMPRLKVLVRKMPVGFAGDLNLLKLLMTEMYLSVHGLERSFNVAKTGNKYSHSQSSTHIGYTFYDALKRQRSKLFEAWARLIDTNGVNGATTFSAYYCSFDGEPTKNADDVVDVWTAEIFPVELMIDAVSHDTQNATTHGAVGFGVTFGGTVSRMLDGDPEVAKLLAAQ